MRMFCRFPTSHRRRAGGGKRRRARKKHCYLVTGHLQRIERIACDWAKDRCGSHFFCLQHDANLLVGIPMSVLTDQLKEQAAQIQQ